MQLLQLIFRPFAAKGPDDFIMNTNGKFYPTNSSVFLDYILPKKA